MPFIFIFALASVAIAVAAISSVPQLLEHYGVAVPAALDRLFDCIDLVGEVMLGAFALLIVIRYYRDRDR